MIVTLETSVLFAAYVTEHGLCARIARTLIGSRSLATSEYILNELRRKLRAKTGDSDYKVETWIGAIRRGGELVIPREVPGHLCRDPKDLPILGTALAAMADVLISGDKDLLSVRSIGSSRILSPRQYVDEFDTVDP